MICNNVYYAYLLTNMIPVKFTRYFKYITAGINSQYQTAKFKS